MFSKEVAKDFMVRLLESLLRKFCPPEEFVIIYCCSFFLSVNDICFCLLMMIESFA